MKTSVEASQDANFRNRHHELAPAFAVLGLLLDDFVREIPRQQKHIIRLVDQQLLRRNHGNMRPGSKPPLFKWTAIDDIRQMLGTELQKTQERVALGRRAITGQPMAVTFELR